MECGIAGFANSVGADADELAFDGGGVVDDGGAESGEGAG